MPPPVSVAVYVAQNGRLVDREVRWLPDALGQICGFAVRRGWLADNPVGKLELAEKPHWTPKHTAILESDQLALLLDHAGGYRLLFGVYTLDRQGKIAPSGMACAGTFAPEPNGTSTLADVEVVER